MQRDNLGTETGSDPSGGQAVTSYRIHLLYWEEKIVAALAQDWRLQAILERGDNFYERIAVLCLHKSVHLSDAEKEKLGKVLVRAGNFGFGKRYVSSLAGFSYIESQNLLNKYYEIFYPTRRWLKDIGNEPAKAYVSKIIDGLLESSLENCLKKTPSDWTYEQPLTFKTPAYTYDVQITKFLKHFFERELEINGTIIHLQISICNAIN